MGKHIAQFVDLVKSRLSVRAPIEHDPRTFRPIYKSAFIAVVALSTAMTGFSSTIYFPGIPAINTDLNAPSIATTLTASLFILFMGIAPVFWAALSDFYKIRRFLLIVAMLIFTASSLGCAVINNIWGMVVLRCVQSTGSSAGNSIGGGIISDLYPVEQRGRAYGKFFLGMTIGPIVGPIIGGFLITSALTWRATFWFCVALGGFIVVVTFFVLPETYRDDKKWDTLPTVPGGAMGASATCSDNSADTTATEKSAEQQKKFNPIKPFLLFRYPHILLISIVSGIAFGSMFSLETVIPVLYEQYYQFNSWQIGLCYLGAGTTTVAATVFTACTSDRILLRARDKRGGRHKIEDRLSINLWPCCLLFMPFGSLLFGWGIQSGMTYWTGIIGFGIQNFGMYQIMAQTSAYLVDAVPGQGASASSAGNLLRMIFACVFSLVANPIIESVGPGYLGVLLAGFSYVSAGLLLVCKLYGQRMRRNHGFEQDQERI